jgi:HAD superfamily hydrolase (TIGR01509 family)
MLNGVIFDMDGVIVDSHPVHKKTWRTFLELHGKNVTDEELNFIMDGRKREEILRHFLGYLSSEQIRILGHQKELLFREQATAMRTIEGLPAFVQQLTRANIKLGIASSGSHGRVNFVLDSLRLRKYFAAIVTGDQVSAGKPDPTIFRLASEQLRVPPSETLVFEDSISGVKAAKAAGMKCIGIAADGLIPKLLDAGAIQIVPNYIDLSLNDVRTLLN